MEDYIIINKVGAGINGGLYIVKNKIDCKRYAMKRVECVDRVDSINTFKQMERSKKPDYPHIHPIKKIFTYQESKNKYITFYVCAISDYMGNSNLDRLVRKSRRSNHVKLSCPTISNIKNWIGQLTKILIWMNQNNFYHGNIKPSNIFFYKGDILSIGDFPFHSRLRECSTITRHNDLPATAYKNIYCESMTYMAPELKTGVISTSSDIWSLGIVIMEWILTKSKLNGDIRDILQSFKLDKSHLYEAFRHVDIEYYGHEIVNLCDFMLEINPKNRPTICEIACLPFVQDCLSISPKELALAKEKLLRHGKQPIVKRKHNLKFKNGIWGAIEHMIDNLNEIDIIISGLSYILLNTSVHMIHKNLPKLYRYLFLNLATKYYTEPRVGRLVIRILENLVKDANVNGIKIPIKIFNTFEYRALVRYFEASMHYTEISKYMLSFISSLTSLDDDEGFFVEIGIVKLVVRCLKLHTRNAFIIKNAYYCAWQLCAQSPDSNTAYFVNSGSAHYTQHHVKLYPRCATLLLDLYRFVHATFMHENLILKEDSRFKRRKQLSSMIIGSINKNVTSIPLIDYLLYSLPCVIHRHSILIMLFMFPKGLKTKKKQQGLELVKRLFHRHNSNEAMVKSILAFLVIISKIDEVSKEMRSTKYIEEILNPIKTQYYIGHKELAILSNDIITSIEEHDVIGI